MKEVPLTHYKNTISSKEVPLTHCKNTISLKEVPLTHYINTFIERSTLNSLQKHYFIKRSTLNSLHKNYFIERSTLNSLHKHYFIEHFAQFAQLGVSDSRLYGVKIWKFKVMTWFPLQHEVYAANLLISFYLLFRNMTINVNIEFWRLVF